MGLLPMRAFFLTALLFPFLRLTFVVGEGGQGREAILKPLDDFRNQDLNATRSGIIDRFQMPQGEQDIPLGLCQSF